MEELLSFQNDLLWTLFLQYLKNELPDPESGLYVSADHPYFYHNSLFELARHWHRYGGELLMIDEVHKYPNWSRELKLIHDGTPGMRTFFTSSSSLDLYKGESDLSRRLVVHQLSGLSFREYLAFQHGIESSPLSLEEILHDHQRIAREWSSRTKLLPLFERYLEGGYFPFSKDLQDHELLPALIRTVNTVLESDLAYTENYNAARIEKLKQLLGVIAESAPFRPNISKIAERMGLGRNSVYQHLEDLRAAGILHLVNIPGKGLTRLQKPDRIHFENPSFAFAFQNKPNRGALRESFFLNQLRNAGHKVELSPDKGDFLVDGRFIFEVGGRNKGDEQIRGKANAYLALDGTGTGYGERVPLWMFGMIY
jgi:predicted AAA+ superfamily ATPase